MARFWNSLRYRLILLAVLGFFPPIGLMVYSGIEQRQLASNLAQESMRTLAREVSRDHFLALDMTARMLRLLAEDPALKGLDVSESAKRIDILFENSPFPFYENLGLIDLKGNLLCSAVKLSSPVNLADRKYFQEAIKTRSFSTGTYQVGRITGKKTINFGYPVLDDRGETKAVLFAALALDWFTRIAPDMDLPKGVSVTLIDANGTVLYRVPDPEKWAGHPAAEAEIVKTILDRGEGVTEGEGIDGTRKFFGFLPLGPSPQAGYVCAGIPVQVVVSKANESLIRNLGWLAVSAIAGLLAVWFLGYLFIVSRFTVLVDASKKIAAGNLDARTGLDPSLGEINKVGSAFDRMAETVQHRETEMMRAHQQLEREKSLLDMTLDSLPGMFYLFDSNGKLLRWNRNFEIMSGYSGSEISLMQPLAFISPEDRTRTHEAIAETFEKGQGFVEARFLSRDGTELWHLCTGKRIELDGKPCLVGMAIDISARRDMEVSLRNSFRRLDQIIEFLPDPTLVIDEKGLVEAWNRAMEDLTGIPAESIIGKGDYEYALPFYGERRPILIDLALNWNESYPEKYISITRGEDGALTSESYHPTIRGGIFLSGRARVLYNEEGRQVGAIESLRNITEMKMAEKALAESEARFRAVFTQSSVGMVRADQLGCLKEVNAAFAALVGRPAEALQGIAIRDLTHPEDWPREQSVMRGMLERGESSCRLEKRYLRPDGNEVWADVGVFTVRPSENAPVMLIGMTTDITENKRGQLALLASEERYRAFVANSTEGIWRFELDHPVSTNIPIEEQIEQLSQYLYLAECNDAMARMYNYDRAEEMIGLRWKDMAGDNPRNLERVDAAIRSGYRMVDVESVETDREGNVRRFMNSMVGVVENDHVVRVWGVQRDITEQKRAEADQKRLQDQLLQAQKMESVGRLAGGVAHDFNNMLSVILGHAELALMRCSPSEPIHARLEGIKESALRSADLVRQLLAFARRQTIAPKVLDVNDTVSGLLKMLLRLIGEDIDLVWMPGSGLWAVKIDPSQIDQILANLCVNARDAIAGVGKVTIETENTSFDDAYCAVHADFICGEYVMLAVSDDGCGMSQEDLEQIFEPFFTTKELGIGTGLGLSTVYGIVKQNEGFINVYSEPGKGTTFKVYLPRFMGEATGQTPEITPETPRGLGELVLLVEDEAVILNVGREMLEQLGYKVLTAETPTEALHQARQHAAEIQLLITDVVMPEMNGRDLAKSVNDIRPGLKCLFTSGYTANVIGHHGVLDEDVHFIQKPFSLHALASKVREALERE